MIHHIYKITTEGVVKVEDTLTVEEPLEILVGFGKAVRRQRQAIAVTMRTPNGYDFDLAVGFLLTEGVIVSRQDVAQVRYVNDNRVLVDLTEGVNVNIEQLNRHFYTTSSCGVCGKASLEAITTQIYYQLSFDFPVFKPSILNKIHSQIGAAQAIFAQTGGIHAAALFQIQKDDIVLMKANEDVGRHNAVDKVIGWAFRHATLPLSDALLWVSGRASFELVQKAIMAGIPILCAVGAPSSLAVQLADEYGMTLIGFFKNDKCNVYTGFERLII